MKLVTVIPLTRGLPTETLTYYTSLAITPGALVTVPLGRRLIKALVGAVSPVQASRGALRGAAFFLKKVAQLKQPNFLAPAVLRAARQTADFYSLPIGQVLKHFIPQAVLDQAGPGHPTSWPSTDDERPPAKTEKQIIQDSDEERIAFYKSLIREEFAKGHSVWLCQPTREDILRAVAELGKGIESYLISLQPKLGPKILLERWREAGQQAHPVVIIATPLFLGLVRPDVKTIIIDKENAEQYKTPWRGAVDSRRFAEYLALALGAKLIVGDVVLRAETLYRTQRGDFFPLVLKQRLSSSAPTESKLVTVTKTEAVSAEVIGLIAAGLKAGERSLILTGRRGLAPIVVCRDCGQAVLCPECGAPVVLHQPIANLDTECPSGHSVSKLEPNRLVCHHCGHQRSAAETCRACASWRLTALGVGIESVALALEAALPTTKIFHLDADRARAATQATAVAKKFLATPGSILLGTEMALHYLKATVDNVIVVGYDSLLGLPDFRIREKVFNLLIRARTLARRRFLIQTRHGDETLFHQALRGALLDFYRGELADRQTFNYPPFQLLIKVSSAGPAAKVTAAMKELAERLSSYEPAIYPSLQGGLKGRLTLHLLLKIDPAKWPAEPLLGILRSLPSSFIVEVDPDQLL